jgi:hypothetical protein
MYLTHEVPFAAKPPGLGEDTSSCTNSVFHKFRTKDSGGNGVRVHVPEDGNPAQNDLSVPFGGSSSAVSTKWTEKNVVIFRDSIEGRFALEFENKIFLDLL